MFAGELPRRPAPRLISCAILAKRQAHRLSKVDFFVQLPVLVTSEKNPRSGLSSLPGSLLPGQDLDLVGGRDVNQLTRLAPLREEHQLVVAL